MSNPSKELARFVLEFIGFACFILLLATWVMLGGVAMGLY